MKLLLVNKQLFKRSSPRDQYLMFQRRRMSYGPSRLYLAAQYYGKSGCFKQRVSRFGLACRYVTDKAQGSVPPLSKPGQPCPKPQPG